jgi:hypothetical protein
MRTRSPLLLLEFQGHLVVGVGKPVLTLVQKLNIKRLTKTGPDVLTARRMFIGTL